MIAVMVFVAGFAMGLVPGLIMGREMDLSVQKTLRAGTRYHLFMGSIRRAVILIAAFFLASRFGPGALMGVAAGTVSGLALFVAMKVRANRV